MKEILQNIQDRLSQIKELKYIDEDWGQLSFFGDFPPVQFPCCLIDVSDVQYSNAGRDVMQTPQQRQIGSAQIRLTIAQLKLANTSLRSPQNQKDNAWAIFELLEEIHKKTHYFSPKQNVSPLIRTALRKIMRDDGVLQYEMVYKTEIQNV